MHYCQAAFRVINYRMMKKFRIWALYGLFAVALALVFAYYRFPADTVERFIVDRSAHFGPDIQTDLGQVEPVFPPGIEIRRLSLSRKNQPLFRADRVFVTPKLKTLLGIGRAYRFRIQAHGGEITGSTELGKAPDRHILRLDGRIRELDLSAVPALRLMTESPVKGTLSGHFSYTGGTESGNDLLTQWQVDNLQVELIRPLLFLKQIRIATLRAEAIVKNQQLQVRQVTLSGDQVAGRLSGTGFIGSSLGESRLDVAGTLKPQPGILGPAGSQSPGGLMNDLAARDIPVRIRGPLNRLQLTTR